MPVHLRGYRIYGSCSEADFSAMRLNLLNRFMAVITVNVRGAADMRQQISVFFGMGFVILRFFGVSLIGTK